MRPSLAVKDLHKVNIHTVLNRHCDGYLFLSVSVQSLRFTLRDIHRPYGDSFSCSDRTGSPPFGQQGDSRAVTLEHCHEECNPQSQWGGEGGPGGKSGLISKSRANYSVSTHLRLHGGALERLKHLTQYDGSGCRAEARRIAYGAFKRP